MKARGFLIPLAASVAALMGAAQGHASNAPSDDIATVLTAARTAPRGTLLIQRAASPQIRMAGHESHYSHQSHGSHASHASHESHYSHYSGS